MTAVSTLRTMAQNRRYQAGRRARLKAAGLCQWCGIRPAKPSKRSTAGHGCRCEECSRKAAKASRSNLHRLRPAWAKLGLCHSCGCRKAMPGESRCGVCAEQQQDAKARRRAAA